MKRQRLSVSVKRKKHAERRPSVNVRKKRLELHVRRQRLSVSVKRRKLE